MICLQNLINYLIKFYGDVKMILRTIDQVKKYGGKLGDEIVLPDPDREDIIDIKKKNKRGKKR